MERDPLIRKKPDLRHCWVQRLGVRPGPVGMATGCPLRICNGQNYFCTHDKATPDADPEKFCFFYYSQEELLKRG